MADIESIKVAGRNQEKLTQFVQLMSKKITIPIVADTIKSTCLSSNIVVTCTPSTKYFVEKNWIQKGTFIAAVGADSPGKNELDPQLMTDAKIVADIKSQVIKVGESQHAINKNLIDESSIYCELGQLITGEVNGRKNDSDIFIYDSTGTAIQDVAAAACIYEKLKDDPSVQCIDFFA